MDKINYDSDTEYEIQQNDALIATEKQLELKKQKQKECCKRYYLKNRETILAKMKNDDTRKDYAKNYWKKEEVIKKRIDYNKKYYEKKKNKMTEMQHELDELKKKLAPGDQ